MTSYLQEAPNLQFTLGLVEIGCYATGGASPSTLLVPRVVMRTAEVTRAIVQIEVSEEAALRTKVITSKPPAAGDRVRTTLSQSEFYELLQKAVGAQTAGETRTAIDRLLVTHEGLEEDFTKKKLRFAPTSRAGISPRP